MKKTTSTWEYKVGINAIIAKFVWIVEMVINLIGSNHFLVVKQFFSLVGIRTPV